MISLKSAELAKVKKILAGNVPECAVLVYGARASGAVKNGAYLDLAVMTMDKPLPAARLAKLAAAFAAAALPFKVEMVDWAGTGSDYRREIKRTAVVLQPPPKA